jgi:RNA polymerase sigma factor (sigma-70 family)
LRKGTTKGNAVTNASLTLLRQVLVERYADLRSHLAYRLGSEDDASETLHEVYLRVNLAQTTANIHNPFAYLMRMALNLVIDRRRSEVRQGGRVDIDAVLDLVDETPGADRVLEGRAEFAALERAMDELTPRQRVILLATKLDRISRTELARRLKISRRLVHSELKRALQVCQQHVENDDTGEKMSRSGDNARRFIVIEEEPPAIVPVAVRGQET